jgi:putative ABC transport system permease protein
VTALSPSLRRALRLVSLASRLVPTRLRDEWRAEWEGELTAAEAAGATGLARHATGAFVDAFWIRQRDVADLTVIDDLRLGWRQLRQQAAFAVATIGILALSMAASVTAFSVVSQVLLRPLPYPDPDRIVTVWQRQVDAPARTDVAPGNFLDWRDRSRSFALLAGAEPYSYDYTGGDHPEVIRSANVTEGFFEVFGLAPAAGRFFHAGDHVKGRHQVVVLSARLWRSRFNADPGVVGRTIQVDATPYVVVGVTRDDFEPNLFGGRGEDIQMWAAKVVEDYEPRIRAGGYWQVVGRLRDGVSLAAAQAEMDAVAAQIEAENPRTNTGSRAELLSLRDHLVGEVRPAVQLFAAAVVAVLLIACVNVTNLLLARGSARRQELAVRTALGASRGRLVGQLLVETFLMVLVAGTAAVAMAEGAMRLLARLGPREVPWIDTLHVDGAALLFALALAAVVAMLAGLVPAVRLSGHGLQAPGPRTMTGDRSHQRLRAGLVAAEVALALVLIAGTGLLLRSFVNLINVDTGFDKRGVMALQMFAWDRHPTREALRGYFERVTAAVAALPGVDEVGLVVAMPFIESNIDIQGIIQIAGRPAPPAGEEPRASFNTATPGYFRVMGIPLLQGRHLDERDGPDAPPVMVISQALADRYFADRDPIGQEIALRYNGRVMQPRVVGVVGATRHESLEERPRAELFVPYAQAPSGSMTLVARTTLEPRTLIEPAKAAIWAIDPLQTFYRTASLEELVNRMLVTRRFALTVLTGFAALALLLAAAGLYGVLSAVATQYRREIGVRMALGAAWIDILGLVVRRGLMMSAVGVAVGLVAVLGGARLLRGFLFSVAPTDPVAIGGAAFLMLLIAAVACYIPARRAAADDPVQALRVE